MKNQKWWVGIAAAGGASVALGLVLSPRSALGSLLTAGYWLICMGLFGIFFVAVQYAQRDRLASLQPTHGLEPIHGLVDFLLAHGQQDVAALDAGLGRRPCGVDAHDHQPRLAGLFALGRSQRRAQRHG